jgi:hypothetical protein
MLHGVRKAHCGVLETTRAKCKIDRMQEPVHSEHSLVSSPPLQIIVSKNRGHAGRMEPLTRIERFRQCDKSLPPPQVPILHRRDFVDAPVSQRHFR